MNNNVNTISENLLGILIKLLFITNIRMKVIGELLNLEGNHISKDNTAIIFNNNLDGLCIHIDISRKT